MPWLGCARGRRAGAGGARGAAGRVPSAPGARRRRAPLPQAGQAQSKGAARRSGGCSRSTHRSSAPPSKMRRGSFSSRVSSTRAALRMRASVSCVRQTSRFCLRPNSPISFISLSRRSFSKGRRGVRLVLPWLRRKLTCGISTVGGASGAEGWSERRCRGHEVAAARARGLPRAEAARVDVAREDTGKTSTSTTWALGLFQAGESAVAPWCPAVRRLGPTGFF